METRSFYDVTESEDRKELARLIRVGVFDYAVLIPEDLPKGDIEEIFREAGYREVFVDISAWPRQIVVRTEDGVYAFKKVEEGVYKINKES
ncbi:conserved hypothetical protein [Pyrobaculum islandicum DSM 4184]|uniref:Uncharacterized protein n=1 Tax=Pyrobaculum islandicum (strain DSM 4184 / JCM 9189 / GEO3) TaxID=384616 RepID=A1RU00_PYRIL|nr:hypothetical protein [Pyrobaculum islandicum]ABL88432.1 conserved hypothetical protein [Pyrobaculum islandicum DSM 4184]